MSAAGAGTSGFPWEQAMAVGIGVLRLSPKTFWALTPREFAACLSPVGDTGIRPARGEFERLMQQFPDGGDAFG